MAGFFGLFDYTKPGKGVDVNAPQKRAFFRFFELWWRTLWKQIMLNATYFVFVLPLLMIFHVYFFDNISQITYVIEETEVQTSMLVMLFGWAFSLPAPVLAAIVAVSVIAYGPLTCGLTYCLRNAVRDMHFWYSDFFHRARKNLKQGLILGMIDIFLMLVGLFNAYQFFTNPGNNFLELLAVLAFMFWLACRNTIYTQAVTLELTVPQILRNAVILTLAAFPRQLLTGVVYLFLLGLFFFVLGGLVEVIALLAILLTFLGFTTQFVLWSSVEKFLIKPVQEEEKIDEN